MILEQLLLLDHLAFVCGVPVGWWLHSVRCNIFGHAWGAMTHDLQFHCTRCGKQSSGMVLPPEPWPDPPPRPRNPFSFEATLGMDDPPPRPKNPYIPKPLGSKPATYKSFGW
jgi:hypothetical protein